MPSSSSISQDLYPSQDDLLYEEEILRNPFSLKLWWRYLIELTRTRRTFDRALCALPVTQHDRIWEPYLVFVSQREAAERLASVLNDGTFFSIKGKTRHRLWLELCELLTRH
ncbi:hypothetical protein S83_000869 [Arachis hypogaea]